MRSTRARRALTAVVAAALAAAVVSARQNPPPGQTQLPPFRGRANVVLVDAYPQREGQIVEGLTAADFEVLEDGKPQKIESFEFVRFEASLSASTRRDPDGTREMLAEAADPHNRVFVTFLDVMHTTVAGSHDIRAPLVDTLNRIVGADDLFGVATQFMRPQDLVLGRRLDSVEQQLTRYWAWGERRRIGTAPDDPVEDALQSCFHERFTGREFVPWIVDDGAIRRHFDEILIERRREQRTLQSLADLVAYLGRLREARTVLLTVSDGWVLFPTDRSLVAESTRDARTTTALPRQGAPPLGTLAGATVETDFALCLNELRNIAEHDGNRSLRDLVAFANRSNVSIYPVAAGGLAVFDSTLGDRPNPKAKPGETVLTRDIARVRERVHSLRTVAEATDGIAVVATNDLAGGLKRIVNDVSSYYLLGYAPTNSKNDGTFRRIEVKVKAAGVQVRARRGYRAPTEAEVNAVTAPAAVVSPEAAANDDALAVLSRLRPAAELQTYGRWIGDELAVVVEIPSRLLTGGLATSATAQIDVTGPDGKKLPSVTSAMQAGARGTLARIPGVSAPGPWRVAVRVTGGADPLTDSAEIRANSGTLLGTPLIFRATPSPRSPLRPAADFQFARTERVHIEWPLVSVVDSRSVRVLDRRGQALPLVPTVTERAGDAATAALIVDVNLAPLSAGDYLIEVVAGRGAQTERKLLAIRVR